MTPCEHWACEHWACEHWGWPRPCWGDGADSPGGAGARDGHHHCGANRDRADGYHGRSGRGALSEDELDELFAPVALYPDALLAQVLLAATYPLDVVKADQFLTRNEGKSAQEMSDLVAAQNWPDPVKGLAAYFPDLLGRMVEHIDWTEQVGDVLIGQTDDALASLQRLRAQAKLNGYLEDNAAMEVEEDPDTGAISISSANPEVVYVPQYTETVYTQPAPTTPTMLPMTTTGTTG
ncbi:MAG: DUF3300 domain-containing protein [Exiguobacterium profundum]|nr:MAG: DUF3300 domain-containing protein [Exiguobacterium profundum]